MNILLLQTLSDADGQFIPWSTLLDFSSTAMEDINTLVEFGFSFEFHPTLGVAYRAPCERLCPDQIEFHLGTKRIGRNIAVWNQLGSTNDLAARAAGSRANDGLAIFAESQTAGRGSRGRVWIAPPRSSILLSVLIFPPPSLDNPHWLTALAAVAVADVVSSFCHADARIKWPNDVRVNARKIAGILVERGQASVIGIGLNVNISESAFPSDLLPIATSMQQISDQTFDRSHVAQTLLRRLDHWYNIGLASGPASLDAPLHRRSEHINTHVVVDTINGTLTGRLTEIEICRGITLITSNGTTTRVGSQHILGLRSSQTSGDD